MDVETKDRVRRLIQEAEKWAGEVENDEIRYALNRLAEALRGLVDEW